MKRLMEASNTFFVRFWGVRGSIACPGPNTVRYGGNTSCLEIQCGDRALIFDAGTGLRGLGEALLSRGPVDVDLFLTHTHFDHVCVGCPFLLLCLFLAIKLGWRQATCSLKIA